MKYKDNWQETQERFKLWWEGKNSDRPLMRVIAKRKTPVEPLEEVREEIDPSELYLDVENLVKKQRNYCRSHKFLAESFPNLGLDLGPGSLALYVGGEPIFTKETVWFKECIHDWAEFGNFSFDAENKWWKKHQDMISQAVKMAGDDFLVTIPDIIENVDIIASLRGPQDLVYDMIDDPEIIKERVEQIDDLYFKYYDALYDMVKAKDGSSSYTCFQVWGPGRIAKVQCDFSALMSPAQFREFALPSLQKQCKQLDYSLYHLDGPDAIKHVDALMEIKELNALQWTCGAGKPDGGSEQWYPIYDKVRAAGKSLWIQFYDGGVKDWMEGAEKLVKRYGKESLFFLFPEMEEEEAVELMKRAETHWK